MIGEIKTDLKAFTFKIMSGEQLRTSLKGLHNTDMVIALVQKIDCGIQFKQESRSQEVVILGVERL